MNDYFANNSLSKFTGFSSVKKLSFQWYKVYGDMMNI